MANVTGRGKPKGFQMIPEGPQVLHITNVRGVPRTNVTTVMLDMLNVDGLGFSGKYPQKYDLTSEGGWAAFYHLLKNGYGIDLAEGEFNIDELDDTFVEVEIVHREVPKKDDPTKTLTFANIKATIGPGEPFAVEGVEAAPVADEASELDEDDM